MGKSQITFPSHDPIAPPSINNVVRNEEEIDASVRDLSAKEDEGPNNIPDPTRKRDWKTKEEAKLYSNKKSDKNLTNEITSIKLMDNLIT